MDPSYTGFGLCRCLFERREIYLEIYESLAGIKRKDYKTFLLNASYVVGKVMDFDYSDWKVVAGVEYPPPRGIMSPALYGLSFILVYQFLSMVHSQEVSLYGFPPNYLSFLMGKRKYSRKEVSEYAIKFLNVLFVRGYKIFDSSKIWDGERRIKNDKLVAFIFVIRLLIKYGRFKEVFHKRINRDVLPYNRLLQDKEVLLEVI